MKTSPQSHPRGYVSYVLVLSTGMFLTLLLVYVYRNSFRTMEIQQEVQLRADYMSKEDAVLRSIVAIVPNRAILAMQDGSELTVARKTPLLWQTIFSDALDQANARNSISPQVANSMGLGTVYKGNTGDSALAGVNVIFDPVEGDDAYGAGGAPVAQRFVASGLNPNLGTGFPEALINTGPAGSANDVGTQMGDALYPIISSEKNYGSKSLQFKKIPYPKINFGYAKPGELFVAKRNWWAFSLNIYQNDFGLRIDRERDYVLSIYEIPSQLAISANAYTALGRYAEGGDWQNTTVEGQVFAGKALVEGSRSFEGLSSRRSISLSSGSTIGGKSFGGNSPFTPGLREQYEVDNAATGAFYPVSLPSESGRAAFVPINRGADFFDRFAPLTDNNTLSKTTWNEYSVGAMQCKMKLDVIKVTSSTDQRPTRFKLTYKYGGDGSQETSVEIPVTTDLLDPFSTDRLPDGRPCVTIKPEKIPAYLKDLVNKGLATNLPDPVSINNSIAVNVDYRFDATIRPPASPPLETDTALVMTECDDLTAFTTGFSIVTNLTLYIGDDFNITPKAGGKFPPASLYAPARRFGKDVDPLKVEFTGQVGSLAKDTGPAVHPLDMKTWRGSAMAPGSMTVNLKPIKEVADLPPIYMMNWLIVLEERRKEFYPTP